MCTCYSGVINMSEWIPQIDIDNGSLAGQDIGYVNTFPQQGYITTAGHYGVKTQIHGDGVQFDFFNDDTVLQVPIHEYFNGSYGTYANLKLASISLLDNDGNKTGYFTIYITNPGDNNYSVSCAVENSSGVEIGTFSGKPLVFNFDVGGAWDTAVRNAYLALARWENNGDTFIGFYVNICQSCTDPWYGQYYAEVMAYGGGFNLSKIYDIFGISGHPKPGKKKSPKYGPEGEPGGYGPTPPGGGSTGGSGGPAPTFDGTSDPWEDTPVKPGVLSFGLLNIYKCDTGALINLGDTLFPTMPTFPKPPAPGAGSTWEFVKWSGDILSWLGDVIMAFSDSIWNKDLIDYIVSAHLIPVDIPGGDLEDIKVGPRTLTGILARPISNDVIEFDCGTIHIDEYYTSYIDYLTICRVYIPYYGMVTIKPEYWQSADLQLKYLWNVMDGSFVAQLFSTVKRHQSPCKTMIGQYSGCACVHMPLSGANYANMFSQLTGAAAGIATGAATGNVGVAATSAMALAGAPTGAGEMQSGNSYNASSAFYGHARPYVIIERPVSHFSTRYNTEKGLPLLQSKTIGSCSGYTQAEDIILDGIPCTQAEKEKIRQMFKSGVIIR